MTSTSNGTSLYTKRIKAIVKIMEEKREEVDRICEPLDNLQKLDLAEILGKVYDVYGHQGDTVLAEITSGLRAVPIGTYIHNPKDLLTRITAYQQVNSGEVPDLNTFRKYVKNVFTDQRAGVLSRTTGPNRMRGDSGHRQGKLLSP